MISLDVMHLEIEILRGKVLRVIRGDQLTQPFLVRILQTSPNLALPVMMVLLVQRYSVVLQVILPRVLGPEIVTYVKSLAIRPRITPGVLLRLFYRGHRQPDLHLPQHLEALQRLRGAVLKVLREELKVVLVVNHRSVVSIEYIMLF